MNHLVEVWLGPVGRGLVGAAAITVLAALLGVLLGAPRTAAGQAPESRPAFELPPVPEGSGTGASELRWSVPEDWVAERPSSAMRRAQYRAPGREGGADAEAVVFYFGPGQGGDADANATRWTSQFTDGEGRPSEKIERKMLDVHGIEVLRVEVRGTYDGGMRMRRAGARSFPGYMLLGAIAKGPDANWFFKLTGPEETVSSHAEAFDKLLRSLAVGSEE